MAHSPQRSACLAHINIAPQLSIPENRPDNKASVKINVDRDGTPRIGTDEETDTRDRALDVGLKEDGPPLLREEERLAPPTINCRVYLIYLSGLQRRKLPAY